MVCREENLKHVDPTGVAKIIEYGARIVGHQQRMTLRFGEIADIVRQASYFADKKNRKLITAKDVEEALAAKIYRSNYLEEVIGEMIAEKTLKISTKGTVVGQVNGLAVLGLGDYSFGKPSRITARTYVGSGGVINIEREIKLSGKIYNKGSMIISGYFGGKYAKNFPIVFSASVAFEQVYEEVDGDSASAAEIYVLLSSLSNCGIRQELAVTGSVNQHGEIQAIGGVNEKIEGFYQVCKIFGLTGKQGVIIPQDNIKNLMLRGEVLEAVKKGKFHVYAITTIDEGIELLMNKPAGTLQANGSYTKGSINCLVMQRIVELAKKAKAFDAKKTAKTEGE
jgi:predicted ATP-dependent protease